MLRATMWTLGLFGAGTALTRVFESGWVEPLVLLLLGGALLYVSTRTGRDRQVRVAGAAKPATATATATAS